MILRALALVLLAPLTAACVQDVSAPRPETSAAREYPTRSRMEADRDDAMKHAVARKLATADRAAFAAITVEVWQGRMLLAGAVAKPEHRRRAEAIARSQEGVGEILNEVLLAEPVAWSMFAPDHVREEAVRRALGVEGLTNGFTVRVINQVAYLLGRAASADDVARLKAEAIDVEGVKWAVAHLNTPRP